MPDEKNKKIHKELTDIVSILSSDVIKALDIKQAKSELDQKVRQLKNQEIELKEVIVHLKETRDKLMTEMQNKEAEKKISKLKGDKVGLESEKQSLQEAIKNLEIEKEQMNKSLEKTNDLLVSLKHEIEQFDEEIRK